MSALGNVVLHKVDGEKGEGPELEKQLQVAGHPTFVLLNTSGETVDRWWGYSKADKFIAKLNAGLQDPTTIDQKRTRFATKPTMGDAEKLASFHETREEYKDAVGYYGEAQKLAAGSDRDFRYALFEATADGASGDDFSLAQAKQAADVALAYEGRTLDQVLGIAGTMTVLGRKKQDRDIMVPYLKLAMSESATSQDEDIQKSRKRLTAYHALYVERDEAKAVALRKEVLDADWQQDPKKLNSFAWWCFEGRVNLEEAEALARKGVELAADGKTKAKILDTLAEICNVRDNCKDAVHFMELAVAADPQAEEYPKKLEQFRKNLAAR